jgi:uncharacterized protein involved in outer membrane biogenesis
MSLSPRIRTALRRTGITVGVTLGVLVAAVLLVLAFADWNALKPTIERFASNASGRTVRIAGPLDVHVWSWIPRAEVTGLSVGNPPWEAAKPMLQVDRLKVQIKLLPLLKGDVILPRVEVIRPRVYLHRDTSGRANWTFANTKPTNARAEPPPKLPVIRDFLIQDGTLVLHDEILKLKVEGTVQAHENQTQQDPKAFRVKGKGTLNDKPFEMNVAGGPLVNLDPDHPYLFDLSISAGDIRVAANGDVHKPFDLGRLSLNVRTSGSDLADLYYLTQLALPNTPPYELTAHIERNGQKVSVTKIDGTVGRSDLTGDLSVDMSRKRPAVAGNLVSKQLRLSDLSASLGAKPKTAGSIEGETSAAGPTKKDKKTNPPSANARLFPNARLQVDRVRAMDADVRFRADRVVAGSLPMKEVGFHIKLDDGVLALDPFAFELPQGKLSGTARIDARGKLPYTRVDVRVKNVQLDQLKGKAPDAQPPLGGVLQARAVFDGHGDSIHDFMADADGRVIAVLPHGEVRAAFAELTGINVARGVGLLLKGDEERTDIRCGLAQFGVEDGVMHAQNVVFDTENVKITGRGEIRLGPEELDLSIKGEPKKLRLARIRTPVEINGHLRKPSIGVDAGKTLKQGAIATAIGTVLSPLAAVIAFVDPGLAKDENCAALLQTAQATPDPPRL